MDSTSKIEHLFFASDHAGVEAKTLLKNAIGSYQVHDLGPTTTDRVDYPDYADLVCKKLLATANSMGVLICGSGIGMSIRANRYPQIRAALCRSTADAILSRQHNNANVICLGARETTPEKLIEILNRFLDTPFEGGRHAQRVDKLSSPL